jgi:hypothetical protein
MLAAMLLYVQTPWFRPRGFLDICGLLDAAHLFGDAVGVDAHKKSRSKR